MPDRDHRLPLHHAAANQAGPEVVAALLLAYPDAASTPDEDDKLPLHYAVESRAGPEVVKALLLAYPAAASKADKNCALPLHHATYYNQDMLLPVVEALLLAYPDAASTPNGVRRGAVLGWYTLVCTCEVHRRKCLFG
mmetsp:Transcript_88810/g.129863  ORF Transcript_88810/g.129863 Transcript_88810/m.129863 type:complete len:138 (+) Transcript_88810:3-416(+)